MLLLPQFQNRGARVTSAGSGAQDIKGRQIPKSARIEKRSDWDKSVRQGIIIQGLARLQGEAIRHFFVHISFRQFRGTCFERIGLMFKRFFLKFLYHSSSGTSYRLLTRPPTR
jgi:hypothetical protein